MEQRFKPCLSNSKIFTFSFVVLSVTHFKKMYGKAKHYRDCDGRVCVGTEYEVISSTWDRKE